MQGKYTLAGSNVIIFPKLYLSMTFGEDSMQIDCVECGGKSIIHSRRRMDANVSHLYCNCKNPECGHTFVMDLSFSHTLSPSSKQANKIIYDLIRSLPLAERQTLLANI